MRKNRKVVKIGRSQQTCRKSTCDDGDAGDVGSLVVFKNAVKAVAKSRTMSEPNGTFPGIPTLDIDLKALWA